MEVYSNEEACRSNIAKRSLNETAFGNIEQEHVTVACENPVTHSIRNTVPIFEYFGYE